MSASRGIPVVIGAGALRNSKLKSFRKDAVKSLQWSLRGIISRCRFAGVAVTLLLISAVKSLCYGNFILTTTVPLLGSYSRRQKKVSVHYLRYVISTIKVRLHSTELVRSCKAYFHRGSTALSAHF